jgi:putative membrane protein
MKNLKFSALLVAAALYACPTWAQAADPNTGADAARDAASSSRDAATDAASSARDAGATGAARSGQAQAASAREGAAGAQGQMSEDQAFVRGAASAGMLEVQSAKLALQKAQRQEVKEFAQKLIDDHTKADQQLKQIAQSKQIQIPREMKAGDRGQLQDLQQLDGQQFEDAYIINQVADHVKAVLKFRNCSQKLQDPQLKQFAQQQLPTLQQHLQHAQQLAGWDAAQTAGARIHGSGDAASSPQGRSGTPTAGQRNTSGARSGSATGSDRSGATGSDATERDSHSGTGTSKYPATFDRRPSPPGRIAALSRSGGATRIRGVAPPDFVEGQSTRYASRRTAAAARDHQPQPKLAKTTTFGCHSSRQGRAADDTIGKQRGPVIAGGSGPPRAACDMARMLLHASATEVIRHCVVAAALCCCAGGCSLFGGGREPFSITSRDPASKIPAIKKAVHARDSQTAQYLVKSLESDDPAVRFYAIRGLQDLTGETFGYVWYADDRDRRDALAKWRHWLDGNGPGNGAGTLAAGAGVATTPKE